MNGYLFCLALITQAEADDSTPNNIDYAMYFMSEVRDASPCGITVENGKLTFPAAVTNPALTCPDAFSWKLYVDSITQEFWKHWAADQYTWPQQPLPLCESEQKDRSACCTPGSLVNPGYDDQW